MEDHPLKTQFYILGLLLRYGPQHGYMLKQTVEEQIADFARLKLPNIYYTLDRLEKCGYVSATLEKDGARPERKVYAITPEGETHFRILMKKMMAEEYTTELPFDGILFFREMTQDGEFASAVKNAREKLEKKLAGVEAHRESVLPFVPESAQAETKSLFLHHILHLRAEIEWLKSLEEGI